MEVIRHEAHREDGAVLVALDLVKLVQNHSGERIVPENCGGIVVPRQDHCERRRFTSGPDREERGKCRVAIPTLRKSLVLADVKLEVRHGTPWMGFEEIRLEEFL
jgi:hypothetical protein